MSKKQTVLVTGASSGFGRLITETRARKGDTVFAAMRNLSGKNRAAKVELEDLARAEGLSIHVVELDVTDDRSVDRAVSTILERADRLDVVVNNAGITDFGVTEGFSLEQARRIFETNYFGVLRVARAVLPQLRKQGHGLMIQISSGLGRLVMPFATHYTASKFALEALSEGLRYELSQLGVDSVLVQPGAFPTSIIGKSTNPADEERVASYGPIAEAPQKMGQAFEEMFTGDNAPDPQSVADAVSVLIETPAGDRPQRTVVGLDVQAVERINAVSDEIQETWLGQIGLGDLRNLRVGAGAAR